MIVLIWVTVTEDWFSSSTQPIFLKVEEYAGEREAFSWGARQVEDSLHSLGFHPSQLPGLV